MAAKRCILATARGKRGLMLAAALIVCAVIAVCLRPAKDAAPPAFSKALTAKAQGLTTYDFTLALDPEARSLAVTAAIDYVNDTGATLETLVVRTYAGAYAAEETSPAALEELFDLTYPEGFSAGGVSLMGVWWNGEIARSEYLDGADTALSVRIPPLKAGERGELTLRMALTIPRCAHRYGAADGVWHLGSVLPILSVYENGAWRTDEYGAIGDPFLSDTANYALSLRLPAGYTPACTAYLTEKDGVWTGRALAVREMALTVSDGYVLAERMSDGVLLRSFAMTESGAQRALDDAARALKLYASLYGAYPYPTFTAAQAAFPFDGMEYPAFVMIGSGKYLESQKDSLELVIAHEAAHQWFYALVGSDQVYDPWQDEAICEYAVLRYARDRYGADSADTLRAYRVEAPMRETIPGDLTPGSPLSYYGDYAAYAAVVYGRGAALLLALDEHLPGGVDPFLKRYCETFAFERIARSDFEALLNEYAESDLSPLVSDYLDTIL